MIVNEKTILDLAAKGESETLEFKRSFDNVFRDRSIYLPFCKRSWHPDTIITGTGSFAYLF